MNNTKLFAVILFGAYAAMSSLTVQDCVAQTARAIDTQGQGYFSLGNDMKYYEITRYQNNKDYITYAQAVRERIKQKLIRNYRRHYKEGDVNLLFIIQSDGRLTEFDVDHKNSTDDNRLIDIALSSLRQASPFSPFPKELDVEQLPFSLTISFKERK